MSDQTGSAIEAILTASLGPPVKKKSTLLQWLCYPVASNGISPKRARALLKISKRKKTKKPSPEVTLENMGLAIKALQYQLQGLDDDEMALVENANKIMITFERVGPGVVAPDSQPTQRVTRDKMIRDLDGLARAVVAARGWFEHIVKASGYKGGADPNYMAREVALFAAEEFFDRTENMPVMPNYDTGPQGSPYSRLLVKLFELFGLAEGSIWNAGKWAVDEMAQKN